MARALRELFKGRHDVTWLSERFDRTTSDVDWISDLSAHGQWVVFSADRAITRRHAERGAFQQAKFVGFFLSRGLEKSTVVKQLERILANWPKIEELASSTPGGALFELTLKTNHPKKLRA